ncbi:uncharacterized protein LOC121052439 [Rosa chinensis]|uniref:uncharacterized protein LOC121052439 n=1 Tax=Rosa chinensis TaxID=74649 RepID=UPI001AD8D65C|nr:uncharacterized protein LOC121052439 [Rosa chinensis]
MSLKGYAGLEEDPAEEMDEEEIDRATLWVRGRQTKDGHFKDDNTKETAEKIASLKKKVADGELSTCGTTDVLILALGTHEHGGRVHGVCGFINPNAYFHLPKQRKESLEATVRVSMQKILSEEREKIVDEAREKIIEEVKEKIIAEERAFWSAKFAELEAKVNGKERDGNCTIAHGYVSGQGSCSRTADDIAQQQAKISLEAEEGMKSVEGTRVLEALEVIEKKALHTKKGSNKVVKNVHPTCPKVVVNVALHPNLDETVEENVVPIDIKDPEQEEGA